MKTQYKSRIYIDIIETYPVFFWNVLFENFCSVAILKGDKCKVT